MFQSFTSNIACPGVHVDNILPFQPSSLNDSNDPDNPYRRPVQPPLTRTTTFPAHFERRQPVQSSERRRRQTTLFPALFACFDLPSRPLSTTTTTWSNATRSDDLFQPSLNKDDNDRLRPPTSTTHSDDPLRWPTCLRRPVLSSPL